MLASENSFSTLAATYSPSPQAQPFPLEEECLITTIRLSPEDFDKARSLIWSFQREFFHQFNHRDSHGVLYHLDLSIKPAR